MKSLYPVAASVFSLICFPAMADITLDEKKRWHAYGDARLRMESDFNGKNVANEQVNDRTRARIRVRTGLKYQPNDVVTFDTRIRTGANGAHQSPHTTIHDFNNNDNGASDINFDKWYLGLYDKEKKDNYWAWVGRNSFPFWSHDEIFWDEDATLLGAAMGASFSINQDGTFASSIGAFTLPVGMDSFNGYMIGGEVIYAQPVDGIVYSVGSGLFDFMPNRDDSKAATLLNGNGFRKYTIATLNTKADWKIGKLPMMVEADMLYNLQNYSHFDSDPYTVENRDQRKGYVLSTQIGDLNAEGHWMAAYYFARIESLAINSTYAQDEWVRWGGGTGENRANNMRGHQLNIGYSFTDNVNILARLYLVESITTSERGDRFRVDLNYKF